MALTIGDTAPDFHAQTTEGEIDFHDWLGDSWGVLFSHPKDFTPVCTTELGYMAKIKPEFDKRNTKIIGLSVDPTGKHEEWAKDIEETQGTAPNYPIIGDSDFNVAKLYGMLPAEVAGDPADRTPADNQTVRNVFVIGPDKKIKLVLVYPMTTGRNFDEVLRVIDSLQLTANHKVATPVELEAGRRRDHRRLRLERRREGDLRRVERAEALHPHRPAAAVADAAGARFPGRLRSLPRLRAYRTSDAEVRIQHANLGDPVDRKAVESRGLPDRLRARAVVHAVGLPPVVADVRVDPGHALVSVPAHHTEAQLGALGVRRDRETVLERTLDDIPRH